jgi:Protein of unknown function (DUF2490)
VRRFCRAVLVAITCIVSLAGPGETGDSRVELVPELNVYASLDERLRLFFLGSLTHGLTDGETDGELGIHLDVTLSPILRRQLRAADWERQRYFWVRVGYRLSGSLDDADDSSVENRGILEATARVPLPLDIWLVNRGRTDLRDIGGDFSARLRYRLGIEQELTVRGILVVPYVSAEVFYDTRFGAWSQQRYQAGVEITLSDRWRIEPYYARQENQRSYPAHIDRIGLTLKYYR